MNLRAKPRPSEDLRSFSGILLLVEFLTGFRVVHRRIEEEDEIA